MANPIKYNANEANSLQYAESIVGGTKTSAGVITQLASTPTSGIVQVVISALYTNTNKIYVGDSTVTISTGIPLSAGDTISLQIADLSKIYILAGVSGEGVSYIYTV